MSQQSETETFQPRIYSTVRQFNQKYPAFTIGGLRHQIFNEHTNGLAESGAVVRNGRRVLLNEPKYFNWLEEKNQGGKQ